MPDDLIFAATVDAVRPLPATASGIRAARRPNGDVVLDIPLTEPDDFGAAEHLSLPIPADEWIGIVAGVSADGASATAIRSAGMVHASRTRIDVGVNGQAIAQAVMATIDSVVLPQRDLQLPDGEVIVPHG